MCSPSIRSTAAEARTHAANCYGDRSTRSDGRLFCVLVLGSRGPQEAGLARGEARVGKSEIPERLAAQIVSLVHKLCAPGLFKLRRARTELDCEQALGCTELDPEAVNAPLGVLLKYQVTRTEF